MIGIVVQVMPHDDNNIDKDKSNDNSHQNSVMAQNEFSFTILV